MARMWPVAIKNELDTFCGFIGAPSTRKVVTDGSGNVVRVLRFPRFAHCADVSEDTSAHCEFLALGKVAEDEKREKASQRGGCLSDSKLWIRRR